MIALIPLCPFTIITTIIPNLQSIIVIFPIDDCFNSYS